MRNINYLELNKLYVQHLMNEEWSYTRLGKLFNVHDTTVGRKIYKWGLKYSIEGL